MSQEKAREAVFFSKESVTSIPWIVGGKIFSFLLYFPISILIVRGLSAEDYGIYTLAISIAEFLVVVCGLGLNITLLRLAPELIAHEKFRALRRLMHRFFSAECLAVCICAGMLFGFFLKSDLLIQRNLHHYLSFVVFLLAALLAKEYINNILTAFYLSKWIAFFSVIQGGIFLGGLSYLFVSQSDSISSILTVQSASLLVAALASGVIIRRFLNSKPSGDGIMGIAPKRILALAVPLYFNGIFLKLMQSYTEIFFVEYFWGSYWVGQFALAHFVTYILILLLPLTLHTLFTSAFAEAYAKDRSSLPSMMEGLYQVYILLCMPIICFGAFFLPDLIPLVYGEKMAIAGMLAASLCGVQMLSLFSPPLSIAIVTKEKTSQTFWLLYIDVGVKLILDYLLIPHYHVWGAVYALVGTFILTFPIRYLVIKWVVGGIYFPLRFFLKIGLSCFGIAALIYSVGSINHLAYYACAVVVYLLALGFFIKFFRVIREEEICKFRIIGIENLNKILNLLVVRK